MSRRQKKQANSVLNKQRPKLMRGRRRFWVRRLLAFGVIVLAVSVTAIFLTRKISTLNLSFRPPKTTSSPLSHWQIQLSSNDDASLDEYARSEIIDTATSLIGDGSHDDLEQVAHAVQRLGSYADVRLAKIATQTVVISVRKREPIFCVEADHLRLVSSTGEIYGQVIKEKGNTCPGPTLSGLFEDKSQIQTNKDLTLAIDSSLRTQVQETLALLQEAKLKGFSFERLQVLKFRGLSGTLRDRDTEITLGHPPFSDKLEKLRGILDKLAVKQEQAQRIELDYQGKAFVKLKKM